MTNAATATFAALTVIAGGNIAGGSGGAGYAGGQGGNGVANAGRIWALVDAGAIVGGAGGDAAVGGAGGAGVANSGSIGQFSILAGGMVSGGAGGSDGGAGGDGLDNSGSIVTLFNNGVIEAGAAGSEFDSPCDRSGAGVAGKRGARKFRNHRRPDQQRIHYSRSRGAAIVDQGAIATLINRGAIEGDVVLAAGDQLQNFGRIDGEVFFGCATESSTIAAASSRASPRPRRTCSNSAIISAMSS